MNFLDETSGSACFSWSSYVSWPYRYLYFLACVSLGYLSFLIEYGGGLVLKLCLTFVIPWTVACQAPLPIGFSRQEYWSGLPFSPLGDLPDLGMQVSPIGRQILYHLSHLGSPRFLLVFARFARGNAWMLSISKRLNKSKGREIGWR